MGHWTPGTISTPRNLPTTKTHFSMRGAPSHHFRGKCDKLTRNYINIKITQGCNFTPVALNSLFVVTCR